MSRLFYRKLTLRFAIFYELAIPRCCTTGRVVSLPPSSTVALKGRERRRRHPPQNTRLHHPTGKKKIPCQKSLLVVFEKLYLMKKHQELLTESHYQWGFILATILTHCHRWKKRTLYDFLCWIFQVSRIVYLQNRHLVCMRSTSQKKCSNISCSAVEKADSSKF